MSADERELLAGEYVLGTLSDEDHGRVEAALPRDESLRASVDWWQRALAPLIGAGRVPVPPYVWERIAREL
jgi:anti-sigma-K factor RskA